MAEVSGAFAEIAHPALIVGENGTELASMAIPRWSKERNVEWNLITPGKPQQNGLIEGLVSPHFGTKPICPTNV